MNDEKEEATGRSVLTVTALNGIIKDILEGAFSGIWVEGEISNFKIYTSGHIYFTLKDADSQVRGVMWKGSRKYLRFTPKDGDKVVIRGRISVYNKRGEYQLVAEAMEPKGLGALQAAFEELKRKLAAEGLFDQERKKPLPAIAWSVGIVTSPKGAAVRDMIRTLNRRFPGLRIVLNPSPVQGDGAAAKIAKAIEELNEFGQVDVIIAGRGGGSLEDLWAFNEEVVARAIAASKIPIVSAVGHEVDFTIADFVADARASTPTAAAEIVAPEKAALQAQIAEHARKLRLEMRDKLEAESQFVDDLMVRLGASTRNIAQICQHKLEAMRGALRGQNPASKVRMRKERLGQLSLAMGRALTRLAEAKKVGVKTTIDRLAAIRPATWIATRKLELSRNKEALLKSMTLRIRNERNVIERSAAALAAYDPTKVLDRGYAIVTRAADGRVARTLADLAPGTRVRIQVGDGAAGATVDGKEKDAIKQGELF
ncbi:MAG: exodeoxyribonuclease VII large subunit [Nitrospinota bacterium]|nr:exodeoxyribonuclease VII large subunit [Nitrospinota bacterium]MDH5679659.1 exodeoxyribonuclease VII large subunit [Nitrospinota bacterium]